VSYTLLSSFCAQMGSTDAVTFFIFQKRGELGFGIFDLILGLTRGTCKLVEVQFKLFGWILYIAVVLLRYGKFE